MVPMVQTLRRPPWTPELYARAVAGAVLPGFLWGGGDAVPDKALRIDGIQFTESQIADYRSVCGGEGPHLPPAMLHLPSFPLALNLMTARDFPMSALGMVHIANRIAVHAALEAGATYDVLVQVGNALRHPKGAQFDVVTTAMSAGSMVWEETSTYLSRGTRLPGLEPAPESPRWPSAPDRAQAVAVDVPADMGRRYAGVSGDRNPIHLHPLAAKAFGFRTTIVHGMWSLARCLAQVEPELPNAYRVDAGFFKPVFLPAACTLRIDRCPGEWALWLVTGDTLHAALRVQDSTT